MRFLPDVPLAPYTTFRIGGKADFFAEVSNLQELQEAYRWAAARPLPVFLLGGGSNTLVSDEGWRGLVIKMGMGGISFEQRDGLSIVRAGAGVSWDELVASAVERGFWGLENLSGIPGSVGGAVVQNIGAYGAAVSEVLESAEVFNVADGEVRSFTRRDCAFDYRSSFFKRDGGMNVVLSATFRLSSEPQPNVSYKDLASRFVGVSPTLAHIREAVFAIRQDKFPDLSKEGTAGSFFKNPILPKKEALALQVAYPGMPLFNMPETSGVKVPIAWFLDYRHGVMDMRALRVGGARLFEKQVLVVAADFGSRAEDVFALSEEVMRRVKEVCGITLEREVVFLKNNFQN